MRGEGWKGGRNEGYRYNDLWGGERGDGGRGDLPSGQLVGLLINAAARLPAFCSRLRWGKRLVALCVCVRMCGCQDVCVDVGRCGGVGSRRWWVVLSIEFDWPRCNEINHGWRLRRLRSWPWPGGHATDGTALDAMRSVVVAMVCC